MRAQACGLLCLDFGSYGEGCTQVSVSYTGIGHSGSSTSKYHGGAISFLRTGVACGRCAEEGDWCAGRVLIRKRRYRR